MAAQHCPRCQSSRVRRGYRPTPWWWMIFGRYNLHCNSCNWEFVGFAIPGTISFSLKKTKRNSTKSADNSQSRIESTSQVAENKELSEDKRVEGLNSFNSNENFSDINAADNEFRGKSDILNSQLNGAGESPDKFDSGNSDYNYKKDAERIKRRKRVRIKMKQ